MSLIPQFKTELQYIPTVKACLKLSQVDCFCLRLKGSLETGGSSLEKTTVHTDTHIKPLR